MCIYFSSNLCFLKLELENRLIIRTEIEELKFSCIVPSQTGRQSTETEHGIEVALLSFLFLFFSPTHKIHAKEDAVFHIPKILRTLDRSTTGWRGLTMVCPQVHRDRQSTR